MGPRVILLSCALGACAFLGTTLLLRSDAREGRAATGDPAAADGDDEGAEPTPPAQARTQGQLRKVVQALTALRASAPPAAESVPIPVPEARTPLQQMAQGGSPRASAAAVTLRHRMRSALADAIEPCIKTAGSFRRFRLEVNTDFQLQAQSATIRLSGTTSRIRGGPLPRELVTCVRAGLTAELRLDGLADQMNDLVEDGLAPVGQEAFAFVVAPRTAQATPSQTGRSN